MRIFLIRHGQSEANADKNNYKKIADFNLKLTDLGIKQAEDASVFLKNYMLSKLSSDEDVLKKAFENLMDKFDINTSVANGKFSGKFNNKSKVKLFKSPYLRARRTADIISKKLVNIVSEIEEDVLLAERQFGIFDGLAPHERKKEFPKEFEVYDRLVKQDGSFWARPSMGESPFDVAYRLRLFIEKIKREEMDDNVDNVIIVCHGTVMRIFPLCWLNLPYEQFYKEDMAKNCGIRLLEDNKDMGYIYPNI